MFQALDRNRVNSFSGTELTGGKQDMVTKVCCNGEWMKLWLCLVCAWFVCVRSPQSWTARPMGRRAGLGRLERFRPIKVFSTSISVQRLKCGLPIDPWALPGRGFSNFCRGPGRAENWMGRAGPRSPWAGPGRRFWGFVQLWCELIRLA